MGCKRRTFVKGNSYLLATDEFFLCVMRFVLRLNVVGVYVYKRSSSCLYFFLIFFFLSLLSPVDSLEKKLRSLTRRNTSDKRGEHE